MSVFSAVEERAQLVAQRDSLIEDNESNAEFVELIRQKASVRKGVLALVIGAALAVAVAATVGVYIAVSGTMPMLMWVTFGLPVIFCIAFALISFAKAEKYDSIYRTLSREVSAIDNKIHLLDVKIEQLQSRIDEEQQPTE